MYYYLYDSRLSEKKYHNVMSRIETRLTDLGINGKINRLSFLKNISQIVNEEIRRGVKTIIVVGDDKTIGQVINLLTTLNITIGIIPVGPNNLIAKLLGMPMGENACDIISSRIIEKIDLGKINDYYFVTSLDIGGKNITVECDGSYVINLKDGENVINISNLNNAYKKYTDPQDGKLDVFMEVIHKKLIGKNTTTLSRVTNKNVKITSNKALPIFISDEKKILKTPAEITVAPKKLQIIVGKNRYF
jgi:diacylglycerol kinase family enzyme